MEKKNTSITDKIYELINARGISQKELSEKTGISTSTISDWKHKGTIPSAAKVQKICEVLQVEPEFILGKVRSDSDEGYLIGRTDELYKFVSLYKNMNSNQRKRILAYSMAMMQVEGTDVNRN